MTEKAKPNVVYAVAEPNFEVFKAAFSAVYSTLEQAKKRADDDHNAAEDAFPVVYMCILDSGVVEGPIYEAGNREKDE